MNLSAVNLNLLVSLKALLDEQNVSRAAERVGMTQSGMSKNLAQLRDLFSDPILVRSGNTFVATELAVALREPLEQVLSGMDDLFSGVSFVPEQCTRRFTVAVSDYVSEYMLPGLLQQLEAAAPEVTLDVKLWRPEFISDVAAGTLDVVISLVDESVAGLEQLIIGKDGFVCCMRKGHPLAGNVELESFCSARHVVVSGGGDKMRPIDDTLARMGLGRNIGTRVPLYSTACRILASSDCLLVLPEHCAVNMADEYAMHIEPLPFSSPEFTYSVLWHQREQYNASHQWFREFVHAFQLATPYSSALREYSGTEY